MPPMTCFAPDGRRVETGAQAAPFWMARSCAETGSAGSTDARTIANENRLVTAVCYVSSNLCAQPETERCREFPGSCAPPPTQHQRGVCQITIVRITKL